MSRVFRIVDCEHSGGGGGGLVEGNTLIENDDGGSTTVKFEGEGEADDAGAGDAEVGMVHKRSLDGLKSGYSSV